MSLSELLEEAKLEQENNVSKEVVSDLVLKLLIGYG